MAHIGADCDGVMYQFGEDAKLVVADMLDIDPSALTEPDRWDFFEAQWGIDKRRFWRAWFHEVDHGDAWFRIPPVEGTIEGLTALRDAGHKIHIVTSRVGGEVNTVRWLRHYDVPFDMLHIGKYKTLVNVDVLVDDWEENWKKVTEHGGRCLLWDQPWNEHVYGADRVFCWEDVLEKLENA